MSDETKNNELLRGGQFLVKEIECDDLFIPEDFSEEQIMMRDSVKEFVDSGKFDIQLKKYAKDYAVVRRVGLTCAVLNENKPF